MSQEKQNTEAVEDREIGNAGDAAVADPQNDQPENAEGEIDRLRTELQLAQDQVLRKAAEFQNYRRRTEEEKRLMVDIGKGAVVERLLDVVDDFSRMIDAADAADSKETPDNPLRTGVEMIYRKLTEELRKLGVEPIEAEGKPFDESLHEAILRQPAPEGTSSGTILQEVQRGYVMNGRVLRHSRVIVASDE
jgi:molecular chaperone GrpE